MPFTATLICIRRIMMVHMLRSRCPGPIVGHTTSSSLCMWTRRVESGDQRAIGVVAIHPCSSRPATLKKETCRWPHRERVWTRVVELDGLEPDTKYRVRVRSCSVDRISNGVIAELKDVEHRSPPSRSGEDRKHLLIALKEPSRVSGLFRRCGERTGTAFGFVWVPSLPRAD